MQISTTHQLYVFLIMAASGAIASLLFDLFRVWRRIIRPGLISTGISDLIFWIMAGTGIFAVMFNVNSGEARWYEFMGLILGAIIYFLVFSRMCLAFFGAIANVLAKIVVIILKIVLTPIVFLYKMIKTPVLWVFRPLWKLFRKTAGSTKRSGARLKRGIKRLWLARRKT